MQSSSRFFSLGWAGRIAALAGALVLLVVGLPRVATAENPELAGEWVLVPEKSKNLGALETVRQWISFDGNNMTIARKAEYIEQPDNVYEYVYIIDGEPHMMKDTSGAGGESGERETTVDWNCLLYTSDAADE